MKSTSVAERLVFRENFGQLKLGFNIVLVSSITLFSSCSSTTTSLPTTPPTAEAITAPQPTEDTGAAATATAESILLTKDIDARYGAALETADKAFKSEQWEDATTAYQTALQVKPQDAYAVGQLQLIEKSIIAAKEKSENDAKLAQKAALDAVEYFVTAKLYKDYSGETAPGYTLDIRNRGEVPLSDITLTIYFLDAGGKRIGEEETSPLNSMMHEVPVLKPHYMWRMESGQYYQAKNIGAEWKEGSVEVEVTRATVAEMPTEPAMDDSTREYADNKIEIQNLTAKYYDSYGSDEPVPGFEFDVKNLGDKEIKRFVVTAYFKDANDTIIGEQSIDPLSSIMATTTSLKGNYTWKMDRGQFYNARDVGEDWKEGSVVAKITELEFAN